MITTDSIKLFLRNGGLVWRVLVYILICILLIGGLSVAICMPFIQKLIDAGCFDQIFDILTGNVANIQLGAIFGSLADVILNIIDVIMHNAGELLPMAIGLFFIVCVLGSFIMGLCELAIVDCMYGYMGSNSKLGFTSCFIKNIVRSCKLQLAKLVTVLPFNILIGVSAYGCLMIYTTGIVWAMAVAPFVLVLVVTVLLAIKRTIFCAWASSMVVQNTGVWASLGNSFQDVFKNFGKIFARQFVLTISIIAITIASIILTASVGLILTIPAGVVFCVVMNMVIYFYINGLKFYVDDDVIVSSKKKESWENINSLRDII